MTNSPKERKRPKQPLVKKTWQRFIFILFLGISGSWMLRYILVTLATASPEMLVRRPAVFRVMLLLAPAETWFWIYLGFVMFSFVIGESYLRGYWPYGYWPFTSKLQEEFWDKTYLDKEQIKGFWKNFLSSSDKKAESSESNDP